MITLKIPAYMLNDIDDEVKKESMYGVVSIESARSISDVMKEAQRKAPNTMSSFLTDDGKIKRSTIVVLNEKIVNKNKIEEIEVADSDLIEVFMQFAGG